MLRHHLVESFSFWWNLSRHWENFKLIVGWSIHLEVLVISFDLSWSLLPTSILADAFFHSYSCCTEIAAPRPLKCPGGISFLDGLVGLRSLWIPEMSSYTELPSFHTLLLENFSIFLLRVLHFFYKDRQILALGYSMWPVEVGQVGWISTCVDCRVNSGFATTEVQLFCWFVVPQYLRSVK